MPLPAENATYERVRAGSTEVRNRPMGVPTSSLSPGRMRVASSRDMRPPACARTPSFRIEPPGGVTIEYVRRSSRPSIDAAHRDVLPGVMLKLLAQFARNREAHRDRVLGDPIDRG